MSFMGMCGIAGALLGLNMGLWFTNLRGRRLAFWNNPDRQPFIFALSFYSHGHRKIVSCSHLPRLH